MKPIFVITAAGGSFDDAWERNECVTDDEEKGQAYVKRMEELSKAVAEARVIHYKFQTQWKKDNPQPVLDTPKLIDNPRWDSKVTVTLEMRAERSRIEELNRATLRKANEPYQAWSQEFYTALEMHKATFSKEVQKGLTFDYDKTSWNIEQIDWLE